MKHIVRATITLLLGLATLGPAYAQKSKLGKLGTAVQSSARAAKRATNPAFQEALSHAKALREIQLNRAVLNAAHTPPVQTLPTVPPAVLEPKPAPVPPTVTPAAPTQPETFGKRPRAAYQRPQYWLEKLEEFVAREGHFPRPAKGTEESRLYVNIFSTLKRLDPQHPVSVRLREIKEQYPLTKTPQQWLDELEKFIADHGTLPSDIGNRQEHLLYRGISSTLYRLDPQNPVALRMRALKQQYSPYQVNSKQAWLDKLEEFVTREGRFPRYSSDEHEERALYQNVTATRYRLDPQDPVAVRIREIKTQYTVPSKPPQAWLDKLEEFVAREGRFPLSSPGQEEYVLYTNVSATLYRLDPQDPVAQRMRALRQQYPAADFKTPQQWLDELETFVAKEGHFPSGAQQEDLPLYRGLFNTLNRLDPQDPVAVRIRELRQQYPAADFKTPQDWLDELETFVAKEGRFPTALNNDEQLLYRGIFNALNRLDPQDPVAVRIRELRKQYPTPRGRRPNPQ